MSGESLPPSLPRHSSAGGTASRARLFRRPRLGGPDGLRNILVVGFPLILSQFVFSLNMFIDRVLLSWYSQDAFTAALQGGILAWNLITLFFFIVGYAATFVAQYYGAGREGRIGAVIWQAFYLAILGGLFTALIAPLGAPLFRWIGHDAPLPALEAAYFQIFAYTGVVFFLNHGLSCFYQGLGKTWLILFVTTATCVLNMSLNAWMIFSPVWIFPEGIEGAAWATVIASAAGFVMFALFLAAVPGSESRYHLWTAWRFEPKLFTRILRFGFPSGIHGLVETSGFTVFLLVVGLFGYAAQFATNMAMNVNMLLFIPSVGLHITATILAGQLCGARDYPAAERMVFSVYLLCGAYTAVVCLLYILTPDIFINLFRGRLGGEEWEALAGTARILLLFVAFYTIFDSLALIYSGALKGAGDTRWVMWAGVAISMGALIIPSTILVLRRELIPAETGMYIAWVLCSLYVMTLGTVYVLRYRFGHWKTIEVIEEQTLVDPLHSLAEIPLPADEELAK